MAIKKISSPQGAIYGNELSGRLATAARVVSQFPQFDSHAVFHRRVIYVDLKPVADDDRTLRKGENVLHDAP